MPDDIDWLNELSIYSRICEFDIGIAPLLDTEINRSKSAFKTKQYLSCGVPVLGSTVGENVNYIRHGINGFICETLEHYEHFIASINEMDQQAYKLLSAGALESAASFSLDIYCTALLNSMP